MVDDEPTRTPCSDEMCTGVLDEAGVCGTCGRGGNALDAFEPAETAMDTASPDERMALLDHESDGDPTDERVPCADEMCTGVLDADRRCGTCGRVA